MDFSIMIRKMFNGPMRNLFLTSTPNVPQIQRPNKKNLLKGFPELRYAENDNRTHGQTKALRQQRPSLRPSNQREKQTKHNFTSQYTWWESGE